MAPKYSILPGKLDPTNHTVSGDSIAYIYPDRETSFLGKFENKFMRSAQEASVQVNVFLKKPKEA